MSRTTHDNLEFDMESIIQSYEEMLPTETDIALLADKNSEVILILGASGAGKSTTTRVLEGIQLNAKRNTVTGKVTYSEKNKNDHSSSGSDNYDQSDDSNNQAKPQSIIGHGGSATKQFKVYKAKTQNGRNVLLLDAPGFYDSRKAEMTLAISLSLKHILKNTRARIAGFALVMDPKDFNDRAKPITDILDLLQQLTSEASPKNLLFCFTKLYNEDADENEIIRNILEGKEALIQRQRDAQKESDGSEPILAGRIQGLESITANNMLLMKKLDSENECTLIQNKFVQCVTDMKGFEQEFRIAMDEATRPKLILSSKKVADQAIPLLEKKKRLSSVIPALNADISRADALINELILLQNRMHATARTLAELERTKQQLGAESQRLDNEAREQKHFSYPLPIQIPPKDSGVSFTYEFSTDVTIDSGYKSVRPTDKRIRIEKENVSTGQMTISVSGKFSEADEIPALHATYENNALEAFKKIQHELRTRLGSVRGEITTLTTQRRELERQILAAKAEISKTFSDVTPENTTEEIFEKLATHIKILNHQLATESGNQIENEFKLAELKTTLDFYCDMIEFADISNTDEGIAKFVALYNQCNNTDTRRESSPLTGRASVFGQRHLTHQVQVKNGIVAAAAASNGEKVARVL